MAAHKSRAARAAEIAEKLDAIIGEIDDLKDEMENWRDNMPENLQGSDKYEAVSSAAEELENAGSSAQEALDSLQGIEFPGMMG